MGALARRRPLPLRLQRAPPRRESQDGDRLRRARPRPLRRAGDRGEADDQRQRLDLHPQQGARSTARPPRRPPPTNPLPSAAGQREGRALPADPQTRMGTRADLPLQRPPRLGTVTLAALLQPAPTPQLARRPITNQPRPQRPEAG